MTMRNVTAVGVILVTALVGNLGCRSKQSSRRAVAEVGAHRIYLDEIDKGLAQDIFDLRNGVLRRMITNDLLHEEARKRGVDLKELWKMEVDAKVPVPDEETVRKTLDSLIAEGRLKPEDASEMSPEVAQQRVRRLNLHAREEAYYDSLFEHGAVQIDYALLGKPGLKIAADGPSLGPADAPITVVEFADLTQSFTSMWQPTLERLFDAYGAKVRFLFKQKPTKADSPGAAVAEASLCANDQQHYWEFRKALFRGGGVVGPEMVNAAAKSAGLDVSKLQECLSSGRNKQNVAKNVAEAAANNLEGEPVLAVNGVRLSGVQEFATVDQLLKNEMAKL